MPPCLYISNIVVVAFDQKNNSTAVFGNCIQSVIFNLYYLLCGRLKIPVLDVYLIVILLYLVEGGLLCIKLYWVSCHA